MTVDAILWGRDPFSTAVWATARSSEFRSISEHKSTIQTAGRFKHKSTGTIPSQRFYHMS